MEIQLESKRIIIADLDGTLAESKKSIDPEMQDLIKTVLNYTFFAITGGGSYSQFFTQVINKLNVPSENLKKMYLFPTNASMLYTYNGKEWIRSYCECLTEEEKAKIYKAFDIAFKETGYIKPVLDQDDVLEDRITQITFSALGQKALLEQKLKWDPDRSKRMKMKAILDKYLQEFDVRLGGTTSIDVTRKGINKAYAIVTLEKMGFLRNEMCYIGDALYEGGNDNIMVGLIDTLPVSSPEDTKAILKKLINLHSVGNGI
ncbi:MAG: HAD-IIB family hydrolase [Candidatus Micrarchaeaceae archaeon]